MKSLNKLITSLIVLSLTIVCLPMGTVKEIKAVENSYLPTISAIGGKEEIDLTITPDENASGDLQYYVYLDGLSDPVQIIDSRIEAEKYSEQSGVTDDTNKEDQNGNLLNNVGGTHNGDWTMYKDIDFGTGAATKFTARYSISDSSVGSNPKLEIYIDSMDSDNLVGTLNLEKGNSANDWKYFLLGTTEVGPITGKHDIYIKYCVDEVNKNVCNLDWFGFLVSPVNINLTNVAPGNRTVTVKTCSDGVLSDDSVSVDVNVEAITSNQVGIEGFQIRTNDADGFGVAFRTVCKAPNVGSTIDVDGVSYLVKDMGTIYVLDMNNNLDESYTYLNPNPQSKNDENGNSYTYYTGYKNSSLTYGYIATESGVFSGWNVTDSDNTYYVRTLTNNERILEYTMHVRAFILAEGANGEQVIIYGENIAEMSIAEVADYLYKNSMASNYQGHKFLYDNILNVISTSNQYYRNETVDYGWNDNLFTPDSPTATYPTEFEIKAIW